MGFVRVILYVDVIFLFGGLVIFAPAWNCFNFLQIKGILFILSSESYSTIILNYKIYIFAMPSAPDIMGSNNDLDIMRGSC